MEDSLEQFEESDENVDNKVTWKEYLSRNHGFDINDFKDYTEEDAVSEFTKVKGDKQQQNVGNGIIFVIEVPVLKTN